MELDKDDFDPDSPVEWILVEPGVLNLITTDVCIVYRPDHSIYYIRWNGKPVVAKGMYYSLDGAKYAALAYVQELLNMGLEP